MNEHDQAVASAIANHPNLGKIGDGHIINAIVTNLPAIIELINAIVGGIHIPTPAPTPAPVPPAGH